MIFRFIRNLILFSLIRRAFWLLVLVIGATYVLHGGSSNILGNVWDAASSGLDSVVSTVQAQPARRTHVNAPAPASRAVATGGTVSVGFSPGSAEPLVVQVIDQAKHSIDVAAYSFTSRPVATALIRAAKRGVSVRVVMDKSQRHGKYSKGTFLSRAGIPVRIDDQYAIMHNKFMVIDGHTVETGSFNFTASAAKRNAENVLVLRAMPKLAASYASEWQRLWGESTRYVPRN